MAYNPNWLPGSRAGQLNMAKVWSPVLANKGTSWGIPTTVIAELNSCITVADEALLRTMGSDRSPLITAQCREAFAALLEKMRFIKSRYFFSPPLTESDFVALLLNMPSTSGSEIPAPTSQPTADLRFPGIHLVELVKIRPVWSASPDPRSDYGVRICWGLDGKPTEKNRFRLTEPPKTGWDLPCSLFLRRKKERFDFEGESGNHVYFCLKYETAATKEGPFGPILAAVIP